MEFDREAAVCCVTSFNSNVAKRTDSSEGEAGRVSYEYVDAEIMHACRALVTVYFERIFVTLHSSLRIFETADSPKMCSSSIPRVECDWRLYPIQSIEGQ